MFRGLVLAVAAAAIVGLIAVGLAGGQQSAEAQATASATRSFSPSEVEPDGTLTVRIRVDNYGGIGQLMETFPADFIFESSPEATRSGQTLTFNLVGDTSVSYTLTAPTTSGEQSGFSGTLEPAEGDGVTVTGPSSVTVLSPPAQQTASATRSFSPSEVEPDDQLVVTISVADYGGIGQLTETFHSDFTFVRSSPEATLSGQTLTFNLVGDMSVSYTLTAPTTPGRRSGFMGNLEPAEGDGVRVGGPSRVTVRVDAPEPVQPPQPPPATNNPPVFQSAAAVSVAENTTVVVKVRATDRDSQDRVTRYAIRGGADSGKFSIATTTGELSFTTAPDFENPADAGANNEYVVAVRATSGAVGRARTATQTILVTVTDVTTGNAEGDAYDANENGVIEGPEVIQAVKDYFDDSISGPEVIEVVKLYFAGRSN